MRLLYVIDSLAPGGAETSLVQMAPGLIERGTDLHVLPLGQRLDLAARLRELGATVHSAPRKPGRLDNVRAVQNVARRIRPNLVHTTLYEADVAGRIAARSMRIPVSSSIVNDSYGPAHYAESDTMKLHAARSLDAVTARFASRFHAISTAIADSIAPRLRIAHDKIVVVPRGRDPHAFPFQPQGVRVSTRQALGIPERSPVLLSVGRLEPQKGITHLLAALPQIARKHSDAVMLLAGKDGRSAPQLRRQAADLRCDVRFLGHRADVAALLAAADVFCFPSEREGLGGVLVEALAVGCPIVASSIAPIIDVLGAADRQHAGTLTPVGDPSAIAWAIDNTLSDPERANACAKRGRDHFEESFTIDHVTGQMMAFLQGARC